MSRNKAFTLIELLVVISIIALLIALLLPALTKAKQTSVKLENQSNMKQWSLGLTSHGADNDDYFPYNGYDASLNVNKREAVPGAGLRPGVDWAWCATDVQHMWINYMMPNFANTKSGEKNVLYNPTQQWHRINDTNLRGGLIGYQYMPRRVPPKPSVDYRPAGNNWVSKERFNEFDQDTNESLSKFPVLVDMIQAPNGRQWLHGSGTPFSSWATGNGEPEGAHYLFEDGHVSWLDFNEIEVGGRVGSWWVFYKPKNGF